MERLLLAFGLTTPDAVLLRRFHQEWETYLPFDGLVLPINPDQCAGIYGDHQDSAIDLYRTVTWSAFSRFPFNHWWPIKNSSSTSSTEGVFKHFQLSIRSMQISRFKSFQHNFLPVYLGGYWDVTQWLRNDDEFKGWEATRENVRLLAKLARSLGCRGLFIDPEGYVDHCALNHDQMLANYPSADSICKAGLSCPQSIADKQISNGEDPKKWTGPCVKDDASAWDDNRKVVFDKAKDLMIAINEEYPSIEIILSFGLSIFYEDQPPSSSLHGHPYGLLPQFIDGLIEGADSDSVIVDGCESYYNVPATTADVELYKTTVREQLPHIYSLAPDKYIARTQIGLGMMYDPYDIRYSYSLSEFRTKYDLALKYSDKYVWLFTTYAIPWTLDNQEVRGFQWERWRSDRIYSVSCDSDQPPQGFSDMFRSKDYVPLPLKYLYLLGSRKEAFLSGKISIKYKLLLEAQSTTGYLQSTLFPSLPGFVGHVYVAGSGGNQQAIMAMGCDSNGVFSSSGGFIDLVFSHEIDGATSAKFSMNYISQPGTTVCAWQFSNIKIQAGDTARTLYVTFIGETRED